METSHSHEQAVLFALRPEPILSTREREVLATWHSEARTLPQLTEEEAAEAIRQARINKGQAEYKNAYAKKISCEYRYPVLDARQFLDLIIERGNARLRDRGFKTTFQVDDDNRDVISLLALYFTGDPRFEEQGYHLRKGIMLVGPKGCGKTWLMELCSFNPKLPYTVSVCQQIVNEFIAPINAIPTLSKYSANREVDALSHWGHSFTGRFFDDLGEESNARSYGNDRNVMEDILMERYRAVPPHSTHLTSNKSLAQLNELAAQGESYGKRLIDRFREMFNIIEFPSSAKSRRA